MNKFVFFLSFLTSIIFATTNLTVNGTTYAYPQTGDTDWGDAATNWAAAMTSGALLKSGGLFTLTAEADFGASYGLKSQYYKSRSSNPADSGQLRLSNTDTIKFRNNANSGNLSLGVSTSDRLQFGSTDVPTISSTDTFTNKTLTSPVIATSVSGSAISTNSSFTGASDTILASQKATKDYIDNNLATQNQLSELTDTSIISPVSANALLYNGSKWVNTAVSGDVTINGSGVTSIASNSIMNADISSAAAIDPAKISALTADKAVVTNSSGVLTTSTTTAAEIALLAGTTSSVQTQLDGKMPTTLTTMGDLLYYSSGLQRLSIGAASTVLTSNGSIPIWSPSYYDPMTTAGDMIYRNASNVTARLPKGDNGKVLTMTAGYPSWETAITGFSDPMTTRGDIIYKNSSNVTDRLGLGTAGKLLISDGSDLLWSTDYAALNTRAGGVRVVSAAIANSGTPSISRQDGTWISSLTDEATGRTTLNIAAGIFSTAPVCVGIVETSVVIRIDATVTTTAVTFKTFDSSFTAIDCGFYVICVGAK